MPLCVICNQPTGCTCKGAWRNIACSQEHYTEFLIRYEEVHGKVPYKLRASDGNLVWDIKDYIIRDKEIKLITTLPDKTLNLSETEYLIILNDEKQHLLKSYEDDGQYVKIDKTDYDRILQFDAFVSSVQDIETSQESKNIESVSSFDKSEITYTNGRKKGK